MDEGYRRVTSQIVFWEKDIKLVATSSNTLQKFEITLM